MLSHGSRRTGRKNDDSRKDAKHAELGRDHFLCALSVLVGEISLSRFETN
jgi:hypothetical protein